MKVGLWTAGARAAAWALGEYSPFSGGRGENKEILIIWGKIKN